jgi:hypothetical protein
LTSRLATRLAGDAPIVAALDYVHAYPQFHCSPIFARHSQRARNA